MSQADFETYIDDNPCFDLMFLLFIRGIPILPLSGPLPSFFASATTTFNNAGGIAGSFEYLPYSLDIAEGLSLSLKAAPKAGLVQAGSLDFNLHPTGGTDEKTTADKLRSFFCVNPFRSDSSVATLADDLTYDKTDVLTLFGNPWDDDQGHYIYAGTETLWAGEDGTTATTLAPVERGQFGSERQTHRVTKGEGEIGTGKMLAAHPLCWRGRFVELYAIAGRFSNGSFHCKSVNFSTLVGPIARVYSGIVSGVRDTVSGFTINTDTTDSFFALPAIARAPKMRCGLPPSKIEKGRPTQILLTDHNRFLHMATNGDSERWVYLTLKDYSLITDGVTTLTMVALGLDGTTLSTMTLTADAGGGANKFYHPTAFGEVKNYNSCMDDIAYRFGTAWTGWQIEAEYTPSAVRLILRPDSEGGTISKVDPPSVRFRMKGMNSTYLEGYRIFFSTNDSDAFGISQPEMVSLGGERILMNLPLVVDDVGTELVVPSWVALGTLQGYINRTINYVLGGGFTATSVFTWKGNIEDDDVRCRLLLTIEPVKATSGWGVRLLSRHGSQYSFLHDLGFDGVINGSAIMDDPPPTAEEATSYGRFEFLAGRAPAQFFYPPSACVQAGAIPVHPVDTGTLSEFDLKLTDASLTDPDDMALSIKANAFDSTYAPPYCLIEGADVVVPVVSALALSYVSPFNYGYLLLSSHDEFNTYREKETYVPIQGGSKGQEYKHIERCFAVKNIQVGRLLLYLLLGGTGSANTGNDPVYDKKAWDGCGLAIPSDFVDQASFEAFDLAMGAEVNRSYCLTTKSGSFRDIVADEAVLSQFLIASDVGTIYLANAAQPLECDELSPTVIDDDNIFAGDDITGITFDLDESRILNMVTANAAWDPSQEKSNMAIINKQHDSIETWGQGEAVTLKVRGVLGYGSAEHLVRQIAARVVKTYGYPYAVMEVLIAQQHVWFWRIGDLIALTCLVIPSPDSPQAGVVGLLGNIFATKKELCGTGGSGDKAGNFGQITCLSRKYSGRRQSRWCPSVKLTHASAGTTWDAAASAFGFTANATDLSQFLADDRVELRRIGSISTVYLRSIVSVSATQVVIDSAVPDAYAYYMTFASYTEALEDRQRRYCYMANAVERLTNVDSESEPPFQFA